MQTSPPTSWGTLHLPTSFLFFASSKNEISNKRKQSIGTLARTLKETSQSFFSFTWVWVFWNWEEQSSETGFAAVSGAFWSWHNFFGEWSWIWHCFTYTQLSLYSSSSARTCYVTSRVGSNFPFWETERKLQRRETNLEVCIKRDVFRPQPPSP